MFRHNLKLAWRSLLKRRSFSLINIVGLGVGMTAFFLIFLYVHFEKSYDNFNSKADRIFRVVSDTKNPSQLIKSGVVAAPLAICLKKDFPEVEDAIRITSDGFLVKKDNIKFQEEKTLLADSTLLDLFDFPLMEGNKKNALKEPMSVILSETAAKKYFGTQDPLGEQVLLTGAAINATITGVMKDIPENSQLHADMLVSMSSYQQIYGRPISDSEWNNANFLTYVLIKPNTDVKALEKKLPAFIDKYRGEELRKQQSNQTLFLEPLRDVYLKTANLAFSPALVFTTGNIHNVYIFSIIGIIILLLACTNFINLSTARSVERAKEVGVRKVIGAQKWQLVRQFIFEAVLISLMAFVLALLLCQLILPFFNALAGKTISTSLFSNLPRLFLFLVIALIIGIVSGLYPALVLSLFNPVVVLKGHFKTSSRGLWLRKGLVIFQFVVSIGLIAGTIIVYTQLQFMSNRYLGFNKDQELVINTNFDKNRFAFKESISSIPGVLSTTWSSSVPGGDYASAYSELENAKGETQKINMNQYIVDYNYIGQYDLNLLEGRGFSKDFTTDSSQAMIINETAASVLGFFSARDAVGKRFEQWGTTGKIIGVVKDFNYKSLQQKIEPLAFRMIPEAFNMLSIKVAAVNLPATIALIEKNWNEKISNRPFQYDFLDDSFNQQYRMEMNFGKLFFYFAIVAIIIGCLGLFGLSSYSTIQRAKEIGVRKIFGASVFRILRLLLSEFIQLVLFASVIAIPLIWPVMNRWLNGFAYRIHLAWWMFGLAAFSAVIIAILTISYQALKAARANPAGSLQSE